MHYKLALLCRWLLECCTKSMDMNDPSDHLGALSTDSKSFQLDYRDLQCQGSKDSSSITVDIVLTIVIMFYYLWKSSILEQSS